MSLDPLRAHYLKKSLVALQLRAELAAVCSPAALAALGPPFRPDPASPARDLPLLAFLFRHFVLSFPFMAAAPADFYAEKLQPFVDSLVSRHLFGPRDHPPRSLERSLTMFISSAIKLAEPENALALSQADLLALERAVHRRIAQHSPPFRVNIVSVRAVSERGRVRSRVHEEFIIRTSLANDQHVCVSRRYGDFRTLADELRKAHPDATVPPPPSKDRTAVHAPPDDPASPSSHRLSREKNRLTLRAYLHSLLATPPFSSSPVLRSFLLSDPTQLSPQERVDARHREEADRVREQGRKEFAREIGARVDHLRDAVRSVKGEIVRRDGLSHVFAIIKITPHVQQLPDNYQAVVEWARISLASTIFQTFAASDNSSETFASLKRIHGLMPYFLLKAALRISNPVAMIRSVLDIFLAQPFGGRSLLQRMFTSSLTEEVRTLNDYIEHVSAKIDSPILCEKIRMFVYAPHDAQEIFREDARLQRTHLLRVILMGGDDPVLSKSLTARVERAWRKWSVWMAQKQRERTSRENESDSEDGPDNEEAWLFEDLRVLIDLYSRLRDREQLIALIFEGVTAELLKDIITIFYTPLAQVYRAASIADSLGDLQNFITDLIRTVEQTEDLSQSDPYTTVQTFIDLVNRHEQSFYSFVHKVHSKGEGLFDSLMKWIERFLVVIREGIGASALGGESGEGNKIALETLLPAGGEERARIMEEIDRVTRWHYLNKIAHEEKLRSRFRRAQNGAEKDADAEDEATRELINDVTREFDFGDLVRANADELAEEESDEGENDDDDDDDSYDDDHDDSDDDGTNDDDTNDYDKDSDEVGVNATPTHEPLQAPSVCSSTIQQSFSTAETSQVSDRPRSSENPKPLRSQSSLQSQPVVPRPRTLSLRSTKSMKLRGKQHSVADVPPVPHYVSKLHPRSPGKSPANLPRGRSTGYLATFSEYDPDLPLSSPLSPQGLSHKSRKRTAATAQPPELKYIPTLLPIFVEMMRPLLRPQL